MVLRDGATACSIPQRRCWTNHLGTLLLPRCLLTNNKGKTYYAPGNLLDNFLGSFSCNLNSPRTWNKDRVSCTQTHVHRVSDDIQVGSLSLLRGIFPTQGSNPGLPHCRRILYQLSHKASPRILEWVAYPCSSGSSQPRNRTRVSCIVGRLFTNWAIREAHSINTCLNDEKNECSFNFSALP